MKNKLHMQKLSVGTEGIADLAAWQATPRAQTADGLARHITRMWPKRADEILGGGSIYWVIKGEILCRQQIARFDEVIGSDGIRRCAIVLHPELVPVTPTIKRPFQGWRYLQASDAPSDLTKARKGEETLPSELSAALAEIGVF
ncbi:MAG: lysophospholipase [Thalassobium sp.]|uniref:DUF1489 family protein n=1 Tax=Octadecabacter sp. SW4 TaxID=2602067 RepID=UPI000C10FE64|nr:DUF1489 domain-containing protein [Octadecabacter sp. SW4]PHQ78709.1 MAG: lysophospholipase [Thalassobium sp.]QEE36610.1 DUF1489 family protein [Octadecabacter sp. SW4]